MKKAQLTSRAATASGRARLVPTQKRSRERFERILECATDTLVEKGAEAFTMSDIVQRTGIAFGSLYQYFPDKSAVIGTLAERYNAVGRECVASELATISAMRDLHPSLGRITDSYYKMFMDVPVMRVIWQATQADRTLQQLEEEDTAQLAGLLAQALRPIAQSATDESLQSFSQLTMILIAAAVRHSITLPAAAARRMLTLFKRLLPRDVPMS